MKYEICGCGNGWHLALTAPLSPLTARTATPIFGAELFFKVERKKQRKNEPVVVVVVLVAVVVVVSVMS